MCVRMECVCVRMECVCGWSVYVCGWSMCEDRVCRGTTGDMVLCTSLFSLLYLAGGTKTPPTSGTKTPPTSGTTGGGIVNVGRLDGEKTAAIVAPIMIVLLIIVVVIVIAVTVVVIYRLRRCDVCLYSG